MQTLYSIRVTSTRIETASNLSRHLFDKDGMTEDYSRCMDQIKFCLNLRNQYAHCNWADDTAAGLFFADLQNSAVSAVGEFTEHIFRHIDVPLLERQEIFLSNTMDWLDYLDHELATRHGRLDRNPWPRPLAMPQPPFHNPVEIHVPPWLSEDQKALYVARAMAAKGGPPTPTPKQRDLDKARADKKAKQEENDRRSREGEARAISRPNET
jgi:hypothetical protein